MCVLMILLLLGVLCCLFTSRKEVYFDAEWPSGRIYVHVQTEVGPSHHMEWEFQVNTFVRTEIARVVPILACFYTV